MTVMFSYGGRGGEQQVEDVCRVMDTAVEAIGQLEGDRGWWGHGCSCGLPPADCAAHRHAAVVFLRRLLHHAFALLRPSSSSSSPPLLLDSLFSLFPPSSSPAPPSPVPLALLLQLIWAPVDLHVPRFVFRPVHRWIAAAALTGAALFLFHRHRRLLFSMASDVAIASRNFLRERLIQPLSEMYRTVRYDERQFRLQEPGALMQERLVLGRMVADFEKLSGPERQTVIEEVSRSGNIGRIMPPYEVAVQHPIRSAIAGDLIQLLLVQGQKAKSDVALSLSAADRLMASNEINLQLLATIPVVFLSLWGLQLAYNLIREGRLPQPTAVHRKVSNSLGRLMQAHLGNRSKALRNDPERHVNYLLECCRVFQLAQKLPRRDRKLVQQAVVDLAIRCDDPASAGLIGDCLLLRSDTFGVKK